MFVGVSVVVLVLTFLCDTCSTIVDHLDAPSYLIPGSIQPSKTTAQLRSDEQASDMRNWASFQLDNSSNNIWSCKILADCSV